MYKSQIIITKNGIIQDIYKDRRKVTRIKRGSIEPQWIDISWIFSDTDYFAGYYIGDRYNFRPYYDRDKLEEYCSSTRGWTGYYSEGVVCRGRLQIEAAGALIDLWNYYNLNKALAVAMSNCEYTGQVEKARIKARLIENGYWISDDIFDAFIDNIGGVSVNGGLNRLRGFVTEEPYWRVVFYTVRASYKVYFNSSLGYRVEMTYLERDVGGDNT